MPALAINESQDTLPSLAKEIEGHLALLERDGYTTTSQQLRLIFEEMSQREADSRTNAKEQRRRSHGMADRIAFLEEQIQNLLHRLECAILDKDELAFLLENYRQMERDELQGAFQDGQASALRGICERLGHVLSLDPDGLEMLLVRALDGNLDEAWEALTLLQTHLEMSEVES